MIARPGLGTVLRLAGPAFQVACIAALFAVRGRGSRFFGAPAETLLAIGFCLGGGLALIGLAISRRSARPVDEWDRPRDSA